MKFPRKNKLCFEAVNRTLQDICDNDTLFGGIPIILGGGFAQIPHVIKNGNHSMIVDASVKNSYIWPRLEVLRLHINMCVHGLSSNDTHFKNWLT